jgi:DNA-binding Lrp family transcriptional regulator
LADAHGARVASDAPFGGASRVPLGANLINGGTSRRRGGRASAVAIGFVLISTAPAKEHEVYSELLRVKGIVELHPLFGEYDLIAKVEAEDFNALGQLVVDKIRSVPGVIDTKTLTGIKF